MISIALIAFARQRYIRERATPQQRAVLTYILALVAAFVVYCLYLKWQVWGSRLQLPLFVLWCPAIAIVIFRANKKFLLALPIGLALISALWIANNATRPLPFSAQIRTSGRTAGYFTKRPDLRSVYATVAERIRASGCQHVGLAFSEDTWEYPLWMLLREKGYEGDIQHIDVGNRSNRYALPDFQPCAVLSDRPTPLSKTVWMSFALNSGYTLSLRKEIAPPPTQVPNGVNIVPNLGILMGAGWYEFEPSSSIRWMSSPSRLWLYSKQATTATIQLTPVMMNVQNAVGNTGQLIVAVNDSPLSTLSVQSNKTITIMVKLQPGYNVVQMDLAAGNFLPGNGDNRPLAIAFSAIKITTTQPK